MSSCSGDRRGGSISTPQAENKKYQSVGTRARVTRRGKRSRVPEDISSLCNVLRRAAVTSSVHIIIRCSVGGRLNSKYSLHGTLWPSRCIHSCGCASPKRLETTCCTTPRLYVGVQGHAPTRSSSSPSLCIVGEGVRRTDGRKGSNPPSNTEDLA